VEISCQESPIGRKIKIAFDGVTGFEAPRFFASIGIDQDNLGLRTSFSNARQLLAVQGKDNWFAASVVQPELLFVGSQIPDAELHHISWTSTFQRHPLSITRDIVSGWKI
jgi:hypothetical protein